MVYQSFTKKIKSVISVVTSAMLILCCLFSCKQTFEGKIPTPTGSARIGTLMSDDEWLAEGYTEEKGISDLPANVQGVINTYLSRLSTLESNANFYEDETMLNLIATATFDAKAEAENLGLGADLTVEQKAEVVAAFQETAGAGYIATAYNEVLQNQAAWEASTASFGSTSLTKGEVQPNFIFGGKGRKFWRAVLRVVVAVAVTAVLVALPVAGVAAASVIGKVSIIKILSMSAGAVKVALIKGVTLGSFKVSSALATGLAAGIKNAEKNYHKNWQGSAEFLFGIKIAPIYH